jgi:hypothetical protein
MKHITLVAVCIALNFTYSGFAVAADQPQAGSTASTQDTATSGDELHFVSVLTLKGEIVAVDPAKRLVTLNGPNGAKLTLEARTEEELAARKVGERVQVRYFEGAQIGRKGLVKAASVESLKDGMLGAEPGGSSGKQRGLNASVERVDTANREITLKGPDGTLETIMVSNPEYLSHIKIGDTIVITHPQGLALSLERES